MSFTIHYFLITRPWYKKFCSWIWHYK